jgi:hypothetical protein
VDKWRNQAGLMDHFIDEIDSLRKTFVSSKKPVITYRDLSSLIHHTLHGTATAEPIEYHWSYVFVSIVPCLCDYYSNQYGFTLGTNSRYSEYCRQYAGQLSHAMTSLLEVAELNASEAESCMNLFAQLEAIGIACKSERIMLALQKSCRQLQPTIQIKLKSYWNKFVLDLSKTLGY